jgi:hypothetical protein
MSSRLGEALLRAGVIDEYQLKAALAHQAQWGGRLPQIVVSLRLASADAVIDALSQALGVPRVTLEQVPRDRAALARVNVRFAQERVLFPCALKDHGRTLWVAMADPSDVPTIDELAAITRARIRPVIASEEEILTAIDRWYLGREPAPPMPQFGGYDPAMMDAEGEDGAIVDLSGNARPITPVDGTEQTARTGGSTDADKTPILRVEPSPSGTAAAVDDVTRRLRDFEARQKTIRELFEAALQLCVEKGVISREDIIARIGRSNGRGR